LGQLEALYENAVAKRARARGLRCGSAALFGQPSVPTWHNESARTGQNLQEIILTPANVSAATFGKLFVIGDAGGPQGKLDGKVDAQPPFVPARTLPGYGSRNVLYVMTEHGTAYAFDADDGTRLWKVSLLGANETTSDSRGCSQVVPEIGITSTPVIDLNQGPNGTIYIAAMSKDSSAQYHQRLHALDLVTGEELLDGPTEIQAMYPGAGAENTFLPSQHEERAGLLIVNSVIYTSWSSHCDIPNYTSWAIGYSETTLQRVSVLNLTPNGNNGGIWAAGSGPAGDSNSNVYLLTGNGTFDTTLKGMGFRCRATMATLSSRCRQRAELWQLRLFYDVEHGLRIQFGCRSWLRRGDGAATP
jgi:outer membrane protein assembly factor BamB